MKNQLCSRAVMKNKKVYVEAVQNVKLASSEAWSETLFLFFFICKWIFFGGFEG